MSLLSQKQPYVYGYAGMMLFNLEQLAITTAIYEYLFWVKIK